MSSRPHPDGRVIFYFSKVELFPIPINPHISEGFFKTMKMVEVVKLCWDPNQTRQSMSRHERSLQEDIRIDFSLVVDGVTYARVLNDEGDKEYDLIMEKSGSGACGCPDFVIRCRHEGHPCKHLYALNRLLGSR